MTICSPEAGNIARGRSPIPVEGEHIVMLPSQKANNCFIMAIYIFLCNVKNENEVINTVFIYFICSQTPTSISVIVAVDNNK